MERKEAETSFNIGKKRLLEAEKAVVNLESKLLRAEKNIRDQEANLEEARISLETLLSIDDSGRVRSQIASKFDSLKNTRQVAESGRKDTRILKTMSSEISILEEHIKRLQGSQRDLETQSQEWARKRSLAKESLFDLDDKLTKTSSETAYAIYRLKGLKSPMWKVPRELWIAIFQFRLDADLYHYERSPNPNHPSFWAENLEAAAAVCKSWRDIILKTSSLRRILYIYPSQYLPMGIYEMSMDRIRGSDGPFICISNLSRTTPRSWNEGDEIQYISPDTSKLGTIYVPESPDLVDNEINLPGAYKVHLVMQDDGPLSVENAFIFPLQATEALNIHIQSSRSYNLLTRILHQFSNLKRLNLHCYGAHISRLEDLPSTCPSLSSLSLLTATMPYYDLTPVLSKNLVSLKIYHNGTNEIRGLSRPIRLPRLKDLGVTYPSRDFLESLEVPNLDLLRIKGPPQRGPLFNCPYPQYGPVATAIFQRISNVHIHSFNDRIEMGATYIKGNVVRDAGVVFAKLADNMPTLRSASFFFSDVDGTELVNVIKGRLSTNNAILPLLETIAISDCRGITRADCEELQNFDLRVVVYI
jgi:hypothetical protein